MRVVSLVPSSTETLLALGAEVVACTRYCEQPHLRHVGGTKNPDVDAIVDLAPDLVVLDREENRREDAEALAAAGLELFVSDVRTVAGGLGVVGRLARAVGIARSDTIVPPTASPSVQPVSVFVPIWRRPWMSIGTGTYGGDLLRLLGCVLVTETTAPDVAYPEVDLRAVAAASPTAILVPSEPYVFTDVHLDELRGAVPDATVVRVDGQDLFWWGIRTSAAIERLATELTATGVLPLPA